MPTGHKITEQDKKELIKYYQSHPMTRAEAGERFNLCSVTVGNILKEFNIKIYEKNRLYNPNLNEDYFKNIDTQNKAYFLGLIIADGNVHKFTKGKTSRNSVISISLQDGDSYILQKFREETSSTRKVSNDGRGCSQMMVHSNKMANDLQKYGIVPNKSFKTYLPNIEYPLMRHVIRGIFDGDGSVQAHYINHKNKSKKSTYKHTVGFCGTCMLMNQIRDYLCLSLGIKYINVYSYKTRELSMVTWGKVSNIYMIYRFLYDDAELFLKRKKEKFEDIFKHYDINDMIW